MAKDQDNIRIYGSEDDTIYLAPLGTTLPTGLAAPGEAFLDAGYLGEDGIDFNRDVDVAEFRVHQGGKIVRKKVTSSGRSIVFRLVEDNAVADSLSDKVVTGPTVASGVTTTEYSDASEVAIRAAVIDRFDAGIHVRLVIPRFEVTVSGTESWSNSAITEREATGSIIGNYTKIVGPVASGD